MNNIFVTCKDTDSSLDGFRALVNGFGGDGSVILEFEDGSRIRVAYENVIPY